MGYTVYELFSDKGEDTDNGTEAVPDGSAPFDEPLDGEDATVPDTVNEPLETVEVTVNSSVEEPYASTVFGGLKNVPQQGQTDSEEASKKEMIRQAMSELGKRSAAARAKKKSIRHTQECF